MATREILSHPAWGTLPARKVLECVFALSPEGRILHHHLEEFSRTELANGGMQYSFNGQTPAPERQRCRIIPPLVREFGTVD